MWQLKCVRKRYEQISGYLRPKSTVTLVSQMKVLPSLTLTLPTNNTLGNCGHSVLQRLPYSALSFTLSVFWHELHLFTDHVLCAQASLHAYRGCGHSHCPAAASPVHNHGASHSGSHLTWPSISWVSHLRERDLCSQWREMRREGRDGRLAQDSTSASSEETCLRWVK